MRRRERQAHDEHDTKHDAGGHGSGLRGHRWITGRYRASRRKSIDIDDTWPC